MIRDVKANAKVKRLRGETKKRRKRKMQTHKIKPGDDLSYYLGPSAKSATKAQCEELAATLRKAGRKIASRPFPKRKAA